MNLKEKKLFLLDMDGTIYLDHLLFDFVNDFLLHIKKIGGRYIFLTNNSSKSAEKYTEKLNALGVPAVLDDFLTSVDATILYLKKLGAGKTIYVFGTESFKTQLREAGLDITDKPNSGADCLVVGFDTELSFQKLEDACILLTNGADFIATNPDWVCPTWYGYVPDCGSVCEMLTKATGKKPLFIGKPQPDMAHLAMQKTGFSAAETLLIGDRIYTDIACGINAGIDAALVLSGETTMEEVISNEIKPTAIFKDIAEIYKEMKA